MIDKVAADRTDDSSQSRRNRSPPGNLHYEDKQANVHENVAVVMDMLLKKLAQREEKPATLAEKLVILLMF